MTIVSISAKVTPNSKNPLVEILEATPGKISLRIKVRAVAEGGKANDEVIRTIANFFGIPKSELTIKSGHTSKNKLLLARGVDMNKIYMQLPLC